MVKGSNLDLVAPLSGFLVPIEQVPDPVFAQKLVGDGISLDPTSTTLTAPCAGEVLHIHPASHALTIKSDKGLEIMMHIGLDTVKLRGEGFAAKVKVGDRVEIGDILIEFDGDFVAQRARSLLTQIVVTNSDLLQSVVYGEGSVRQGESVILELLGADESSESSTNSGAEGVTEVTTVTSEAIVIPNPAGLHARPSAVLANHAKQFKAKIVLRRGDEVANAKSVVALMGLNVKHGDKVTLQAIGADGQNAVDTLLSQMRDGLGEDGAHASAPGPSNVEERKEERDLQSEREAPPRSGDPNLLLGLRASTGLAVGKVFQLRRDEIKYSEKGEDAHQERKRLDSSLEEAKIELEALQERLKKEADPQKAEIFAAHRELLDDPDLIDIAASAIVKGKSAEGAWKCAYETHAGVLESLDNELLAGRANDLRDVGSRVMRILTGVAEEKVEYPENTIIIAEDLTPSDTANLDRNRVMGFCTIGGGATSHVAIIARSLDLPAIVGLEARALSVENGTSVVLDGGSGKLRLNPSKEEIEQINERLARMKKRREEELASALEEAKTKDGHQILVVANIGGAEDAKEAVKLGGEGAGLLRSEFLFLERQTEPTEDEQYEAYCKTVEALGEERPLTIRTLDVGGDKPLPYLPIPEEENPFLGERGIRVCLNRPELFRTHLRAILRAGRKGKVQVMFPMIASLDEFREAKKILEEEAEKLGHEPIPAGIMVEVPAAAVRSELFAQEAAFFSIGTNDLTQYTLAMDRGHAKLAPQIDALHPAVLSLIERTIEGAHAHGKKVSICGGIASDPSAVPILVGLGVDKLSVSVPSIPTVKAVVRRVTLDECKELAQKALNMATAAEVRALVPALD